MSQPTYLRKKLRRILDDMIAHVCSLEEGQHLAGMELEVEHEDGEWDDVTIIVIRGAWYDFLEGKTASNFTFPAYLPKHWEGSE